MKLNFGQKRVNVHRADVVQLPEKDIKIDMYYSSNNIIKKLLGLYTIKVNGYKFKRPLRITDCEGNLPSLRSTLVFPGILLKYAINKIRKRFVVKNPKPFIVVDAVDFIQKRLFVGAKVLETGAGNSTLWFLSQKCVVTSVEHDEFWAKDIAAKAKKIDGFNPSNLSLKVANGKDALNYLSEINDKFDVILIDSMNKFLSRYESIKLVRNKLTKDGILVLDNSDGMVNWKAMSLMDGIDYRTFTGYAYNCPIVTQTTAWEAHNIVSSNK